MRNLHVRWVIALIVFVAVLLVPVILSIVATSTAAAAGCPANMLPC